MSQCLPLVVGEAADVGGDVNRREARDLCPKPSAAADGDGGAEAGVVAGEVVVLVEVGTFELQARSTALRALRFLRALRV